MAVRVAAVLTALLAVTTWVVLPPPAKAQTVIATIPVGNNPVLEERDIPFETRWDPF